MAGENLVKLQGDKKILPNQISRKKLKVISIYSMLILTFKGQHIANLNRAWLALQQTNVGGGHKKMIF